MGFFSDAFGGGTGGTLRGLFDPGDLLGTGAQEAAERSAQEQEAFAREALQAELAAREQAQGFFSPFAGLGQLGIDQANFLIDPQAQFDFLQNNPLFDLGLQNLNQQTQSSAAARGRLSAGDTLAQLQNNALLAAQPLIDRQSQGISGLLNLGTGIAQSQANTAIGQGSNVGNILSNIGAIRAGGIVGGQNARSLGTENLGQIAGLVGSFFSDSRLKENAEIVGKENGYDVWEWDWNDAAKKFGLVGKSKGVMLIDVIEKDPDAVSYESGFGKVNYDMIEVRHG